MPVIKVENLGKKYVLGHQHRERYIALRDVIASKVKSLGKRFVPGGYGNPTLNPSQEDFWALRNVSFDIEQGEKVGIIGRNGAGKTTLLKILSRITEPTEGRARIKGRVASLLEVGTGFHPELTGRENIYLNGAILGMQKAEIKKKFDEIVSFAEVEKFLDTPVKRYSSGMYVRLAFSVAAHLEPEILLVDEVLAVGDASFQNKCLGKMEEVSTAGRTVLFVSHNMPAIRSLCQRVIYLKDGRLEKEGEAAHIIEYYLNEGNIQASEIVNTSGMERSAGREKAIKKAWIEDEQGKIVTQVFMGKPIKVYFEFTCSQDIILPGFGFGFETSDGQRIFSLNNYVMKSEGVRTARAGIAECYINEMLLLPGSYRISLSLVQSQTEWIDHIEHALIFTVLPYDVYSTGKIWDKSQGIIYTKGGVTLKND